MLGVGSRVEGSRRRADDNQRATMNAERVSALAPGACLTSVLHGILVLQVTASEWLCMYVWLLWANVQERDLTGIRRTEEPPPPVGSYSSSMHLDLR